LTAEQVNTLEFAREQSLGSRAALVTSVFAYRLNGLIEGIPITPDVMQYRNSSRVSARGFEAEWSGRPVEWLETAFSFSVQNVRGDSGTRLQNSPNRLGRLRIAAPLLGNRLHFAAAVRYVGPRLDAWGETVGGAALADATLTAPFIRRAFDLQFGVRNLLNTYWEEPLSPEHIPQRLPGAGRTAFVKMTWRYD
jgi:outer membrane receptor protein involved in Fe transport